MYQIGGTIQQILKTIQQNKFVLPAIQREFVWKPEQIARLFDSLMQGYPFGTFLYWKVEKVCSMHEVMAKRGKSLQFGEQEIDELVEMQYGDKRLFALLSLLFPFVDVTRHTFYIDHVFPKSQFTKPKLKKAGVPQENFDEFKEMANSLPNLQLLDGAENLEKQAEMPAKWMAETLTDSQRTNYCDNHVLGDVPESLPDFKEFYDTRSAALRQKIVSLLGVEREEAE